MNQKPLLSAIVIAKNEGERLYACLRNLSWADELILVDNGSTDNTVQIARQRKATIIKERTNNFARLRNIGAKSARGVWLLYIDADETVTVPLRDEIIGIMRQPKSLSAYVLPRKNIYLGRPWPYRDGMVRLIKKESFVTWEGILHEHAIVRGAIGSLTQACIHTTHRTLSEMVEKTNEWSAYEAALRFGSKHPPIRSWRIIRVMVTSFFDSFIRQGGWRAGTTGWIESIYQSFSIFITYAKLWEVQNKYI